MTPTPRRLHPLGAWIAGALIASAPALSAETLRVVMQSGLRVTDPVMTTAFMTRDHGYMIYDTLLGVDADFNIRPQMADWSVSDDGLVYTFTLREGLLWHDGSPVTAEDCLASIRRWSGVDGTGMPLMTLVADMRVVDDRSFTITLTQPTTLLLAGLSKISSRAPFMMPKAVAETPSDTAISSFVGSGPFRFVEDEFDPGVKAVYARSPDYLPRDEPPSWTAGGKVVHVERVEWIALDPMTAISALQNGEVDFIQQVPFDMLPLLEGQPDERIEVLDPLGNWTYFRMNHLYPPFDNKLVRQAAIAAVSQHDVLQVLVGNPDYYETCAAIMGCGNPNGHEVHPEWVVEADLDRAAALLAEAGYDGTPVIILQPTDLAMVMPQPVVIADALRRAGFTVELKPMDWQTVVMQQSNQNPPAEGGWNILSTFAILATSGDPFGNTPLSTAGRASWAGWPDVPQIEALRLDYAKAADPETQREIAARIQEIAIDEGVVAPMGQFRIPAAYNAEWSGFLHAPVTLFWNVEKTGG
ncbi:MAG: ABC transporter substrate-binding protein [Paracoccus sp. (in: a-proteobacteria)]|nr:ABC transporter substrate-binding protein [Paracoccus sp. (in: a-proteobacteria)]